MIRMCEKQNYRWCLLICFQANKFCSLLVQVFSFIEALDNSVAVMVECIQIEELYIQIGRTYATPVC